MEHTIINEGEVDWKKVAEMYRQRWHMAIDDNLILRKENQKLKEQNISMSWEINPDRMGQ